ncbi:MAG: Ppx/GppA family phosphatase [Myxococcota bacterium]|nr:Ppx/GppA family phosphatase [Myxococcota bacterium]
MSPPLPGALGLPPRAAGIDIGTNTCSMAVVGRVGAGPVYEILEDYAVVTSLGRGRDEEGRLHPDSITRTMTVLRMFRRRLQMMDVPQVRIAATSAVRDAPDGGDFANAVADELDASVAILSGEEEAATVYSAVDREFGDRGVLAMVDVGGGSTELAHGSHGRMRQRVSVDLGALRCTEGELRGIAPPEAADLRRLEGMIRAALRPIPAPDGPLVVVGIGGTATIQLAVRDAIDPYDGRRIHGVPLAVDELRGLVARGSRMTVAEIAALPGMEAGRAPYALAGAMILQGALEHLGVDSMLVSDRGLRYGLLLRPYPDMRIR